MDDTATTTIWRFGLLASMVSRISYGVRMVFRVYGLEKDISRVRVRISSDGVEMVLRAYHVEKRAL